MGWGVSTTPRPLYPGKDPVLIVNNNNNNNNNNNKLKE
jgi:hypothetical protein